MMVQSLFSMFDRVGHYIGLSLLMAMTALKPIQMLLKAAFVIIGHILK